MASLFESLFNCDLSNTVEYFRSNDKKYKRFFFGIFHYIAENWVLFMNSVTVECRWKREMGETLKIFAMQKANS